MQTAMKPARHWLAVAAAVAAVTCSAAAQTRATADAAPTFEVASVKPSVPRPSTGGRRGGGGMACPQSFTMNRSRVDIRCANVETLIAYAYRLRSRVTRPTGPDWIAGL